MCRYFEYVHCLFLFCVKLRNYFMRICVILQLRNPCFFFFLLFFVVFLYCWLSWFLILSLVLQFILFLLLQKMTKKNSKIGKKKENHILCDAKGLSLSTHLMHHKTQPFQMHWLCFLQIIEVTFQKLPVSFKWVFDNSHLTRKLRMRLTWKTLSSLQTEIKHYRDFAL